MSLEGNDNNKKRLADLEVAAEDSNNNNKRLRAKSQQAVGFRLRRLTAAPNEQRRTNDEIHSSVKLCPVMTALVDTPPMQRLRGIKQLGTAEYVFMNVDHNRFEHSLGVACLAERMCRHIQQKQPQLGLTEKDILCVKLAGLMHDVGHGPFSHVFEAFIGKSFPAYLNAHPHLKQRHYENLPDIPKNWRHEMVSLMMIDAILAHIGLAIDLDNLDAPLKQIGDGIDATSMRVFGVEGNGQEFILSSRDFVFIKECIWGGPLPNMPPPNTNNDFVGRPSPDKEWLYDIVSNRHSGLDVDKVDYYARDERRADRASGEIKKRMIEEAVVAYGECTEPNTCFRCQNNKQGNHGKHLMICYPEKMVKNAIEFFRKRFELHSEIYKHKTSVAVSYMIMDILCYADPYFRLPTSVEGNNNMNNNTGKAKLGFDRLPISRSMLDQSMFLRLRDSIIDQIANTTDDNLRKARQLISRLWARDLYKCVAEKPINIKDPKEARLWQQSETTIKEDMLKVQGLHDGENGVTIELKEEDFIVERCTINYGQKEENPLNRMRFLEKTRMHKLVERTPDLPTAAQVDEERYAAHLPKIFEEKIIRVYCRDPSKVGLLSHVFHVWLGEMFGEIEITPMTDEGNDGEGPPPASPPPARLSQESDEEQDNSLEDGGYNNAAAEERTPITPPRRRYKNY